MLYLQKALLENVTQYTYLGFTIAASGIFSHGIQKLIDKAKRAWFLIQRILNKSKLKNTHTYTLIFDNVIKPIVLYSCEIWGKSGKLDGNIENFGNSIWERFHTRICKNILGVHRWASNIATLTEIGRYPISIEIHKRMIRYLLRFKNMDEEKLVYKAFKEQQKDTNNKNNWVGKIK